jgi:hypothetical protein
MSKKINVNPGQYKVAGRAHQGEDIVHDIQRRAYTQQQAQAELWQPKRQETPQRPAPPPARKGVLRTQAGRTPPKTASQASVAKAKAKGKANGKKRTKAARASKTAAKKRRPPARKASATARRKNP